ncbi:hypothetical protein J2S74_002024 [Evansella vedderi]|uniref:Uncharacterized protein n=1 Tax=Evansella vedderi TaxID=38282 RepID=A0ABT9ZUM9_9BACI|nr:DUF6154 family protein [Evansella vedderi]MDQ0254645.1 hypothetical protein [Evansella vedderi]
MKFIDDLYEMYSEYLTGKEDDAMIIIESILEDVSSNDLKKFISNLSAKEQYEMVALYLYEKFRLKMEEKKRNDLPIDPFFH